MPAKLDDLIKVATGLGCNMESLISDLKYQYAASATAAVSQAMLLQALNRSRQVASKISLVSPQQQQEHQPQQEQDQQTTNGHKLLGGSHTSRLPDRTQAKHHHHHHHHNHNYSSSSAHACDQHAPLDLSVKSPDQHTAYQTTRSRSHSKQLKQQPQQQQQQPLPLGLFKTITKTKTAPVPQQRAVQQKKNNHSEIDNHRRPAPSNQLKLITSSTSPTSSGSSSTSSLSLSSATNYQRGPATISMTSPQPARCALDTNNNQLGQVAAASLPGPYAHHDVISSTNGRRQRRGQTSKAAGKKQKGAKSHLCNYCGRSFSRSDMLTRHSRLHSGLKPYQCGKCYQVFSRSDHLSTHERTHTGEKPYQCNYCDYSACRRDMITRHMRTHTAGQEGELSGTKLKARHRRPRPQVGAESEDSSDKMIGESKSEDDLTSNFEMSVSDNP